MGGPPAADLSEAGIAGAVLCPATRDAFALALPGGVAYRVRLIADGLDLGARSAIGLELDVDGLTRRRVGADAADGLTVEVGENVGAIVVDGTSLEVAADYALSVERVSSTCGLPNDGALELGVTGSLCPASTYGVRRDLPVGTVLTACVDLSAGGEVLLELLDARTGATWAVALAAGRGRVCRPLGPVARETDLEIRLSNRGPSAVPLTVSAEASLAPPDGVVTSWGAALTTDRDPVTGTLLALVDTRIVGAALLGAGEGLAGWASPGVDPVRVVAADVPTALGAVRVSPGGVGAQAWTLPIRPDGSDGFVAAEADYGALPSLRVAAVAQAGVERLRPFLGAAANLLRVPVHYRWSPHRAAACGTCFLPGEWPIIELSGADLDPDEGDDAIILHELGHWAASVFGRDDSPGGAHNGERVPGPVAWSEGFADFQAAWQLGEPLLGDARADGPHDRDIDAASQADPLALGTSDGTALGLVSERLVSAFLWDLLDSGSPGAPDDDDVALAEGLVLGAALGAARSWTQDRGPVGFDLVDYLDVLGCEDGAAGGAAASLAESRGFAYEAGATCP